jgi:hypothetical protein
MWDLLLAYAVTDKGLYRARWFIISLVTCLMVAISAINN